MTNSINVFSQSLPNSFQPNEAAKPWVLWYWTKASVSKEGITADLEAMRDAGIGGAHFVCVRDTPALVSPAVRQLSPLWWDMVKFTFSEAKRVGIQLAVHVSDGFALAGGPWITPELSMQKLVWSKAFVSGNENINIQLPRPETNEGYYKDIAVYAYPTLEGSRIDFYIRQPVVTCSLKDKDASMLAKQDNKESFKTSEACWIQYAFDSAVTFRSVIIKSKNNYQSQRLIVLSSNDGEHFDLVDSLQAPRHGWQDWDFDHTYAIPATTAKYFRFVYDKEGSEPGAEDLDAAKWSPSLSLTGIELSGEPVIDQYEGKNASVWRISKRTTENTLPDNICVPADKLINITSFVDDKGMLHWEAPAGNWTILRMGHTSTGQTNATGGGGKGLECDKFSPQAIQLQYDNWFGAIINKVGPSLAKEVVKYFYIDSWECGSQNWSVSFRDEFKKRRGYDIVDYLPVMTGLPLQSADFSEKILYDVRNTVAELINDVFYKVLADLAHAQGFEFTAENVAPTMVSDGMLHFNRVDVPMGEYWLNSPTHDKPNDMLDAIHAAHIYGKRMIGAEAFTTLRMAWNEHPGMLKALQDYSYTLGVNRLAYHVFMHSPFLDRKPGITLDPIGLFFQRDQTWWKQGKTWVDYAARCQSLLQQGWPVADIAVFTGEEIPRRSILPDRLVPVLPGLFGKDKVKEEAERLANKGVRTTTYSLEVKASANIVDPQQWMNPLNGYAYDSFNPDALLRLAKVENGKVVFGDGTAYSMLVIPGARRMSPDSGMMSLPVVTKLLQLANDGATILTDDSLFQWPGLVNTENHGFQYNIAFKRFNDLQSSKKLLNDGSELKAVRFGKGQIIHGVYQASSLNPVGVERDFEWTTIDPTDTFKSIGYVHRQTTDADFYFISNQLDKERAIEVSLRCAGKIPELWDAVSGEVMDAKEWSIKNGRTVLPVRLYANGSIFIVLKTPTTLTDQSKGKNWIELIPVQQLNDWKVQFDTASAGPLKPVDMKELRDWTSYEDQRIKFYSGTATYQSTFNWKKSVTDDKYWLDLGDVENLATVYLNGIDCGTAWTKPYQLNISNALVKGKNTIRVEVTNTWANRIMGDQLLPEEKRITWTTAPYKLKEQPLNKAGLLGPVVIKAPSGSPNGGEN